MYMCAYEQGSLCEPGFMCMAHVEARDQNQVLILTIYLD